MRLGEGNQSIHRVRDVRAVGLDVSDVDAEEDRAHRTTRARDAHQERALRDERGVKLRSELLERLVFRRDVARRARGGENFLRDGLRARSERRIGERDFELRRGRGRRRSAPRHLLVQERTREDIEIWNVRAEVAKDRSERDFGGEPSARSRDRERRASSRGARIVRRCACRIRPREIILQCLRAWQIREVGLTKERLDAQHGVDGLCVARSKRVALRVEDLGELSDRARRVFDFGEDLESAKRHRERCRPVADEKRGDVFHSSHVTDGESGPRLPARSYGRIA